MPEDIALIFNGTKFQERKVIQVFGKNTRQENPATGAIMPEEKNAELIESIMNFIGVQSVEELEEIIATAQHRSDNDNSFNDDMLFNAIKSVKDNHSILDAKEMEKNEDFVSAVLAGFEPEKAYMLANMENLIEEAFKKGEAQGKKNALEKSDRINEEGVTLSSGYKAEIDPKNMTMGELKKIKERLKKGENIRL